MKWLWNNAWCTNIKTNLFASLVDQLLPESEGFQMLQSISVETKYLLYAASNIQLNNQTIIHIKLLPEYFHYCQQRDYVFLLFQTQLQFEKISYTLCHHVYTSSSIIWLVKMCCQKHRLTYLHFLSCSLKSIFKNVAQVLCCIVSVILSEFIIVQTNNYKNVIAYYSARNNSLLVP